MDKPAKSLKGARCRDEILRIEFAAPGTRSRKVISRSNTRPTGRFPSQRMNRMIHWDSPHELNAYRLLDSNPAVRAFSEQPCIIYYKLDDKEYRHFPDSLVETAAVRALWEIKTTADARKPEVVARTQLLTEHLPSHGYQYCMVLAEDLSREPRLHNVRLLLRQGRTPLSVEQMEYCRRLFLATPSLRWLDVVEGRHAPFTMQHACRMVIEGNLHINLDKKFDATSQLVKVASTILFGDGNG